jgi:hypothetical protein
VKRQGGKKVNLKSYVDYSWFSLKRQRLRFETTILCFLVAASVASLAAPSCVASVNVVESGWVGSSRSFVNLSTMLLSSASKILYSYLSPLVARRLYS